MSRKTLSLWLFLCAFFYGLGFVAPYEAVAAKKSPTASSYKKTVKPKQKTKSYAGKKRVSSSGKSKKTGRAKQSRKLVVKERRIPYEDTVLAGTGNLLVQSNAALVVDSVKGSTLYSKNASAVMPIASISKLMTAMVILDARQGMNDTIVIGPDDIDYLRGTSSRMPVGTEISRQHALLLALMSSENRVTHALARHYPGGLPACVAAMNKKATELGMKSTHFDDPTGLSSSNVSTAADLGRMVTAAYKYPLIREYSTSPGATVELGERRMEFRNTNSLVKSPDWEIYLSKTGFIREAGRCLVMFARVADKNVAIVLLDATGQVARQGDAQRIKRWMEIL